MTDTREALSGRLLDSLVGAMELYTVHLGRELGLYAALRGGPLTASELAKAADVDGRYAREWLEQQAAAGLLHVDDVAAAPDERRFGVDEGVAEVLLDEAGPWFFGTPADFALGLAAATPAVATAFRRGDGVPYADYGPTFGGPSPGSTGRCSATSWPPSGSRLSPPYRNNWWRGRGSSTWAAGSGTRRWRWRGRTPR